MTGGSKCLVALPPFALLLEHAAIEGGALPRGGDLDHVTAAAGAGDAPISVTLGLARLGDAHKEWIGADAPHTEMVGELRRAILRLQIHQLVIVAVFGRRHLRDADFGSSETEEDRAEGKRPRQSEPTRHSRSPILAHRSGNSQYRPPPEYGAE
jgi:hypothetical protein